MPLITSIENSVSALKSFTKGIDVIGNNIANVNSVAFKASRVDYAESFSNTLQRSVASTQAGRGNSTTLQVGSGVKLGDIRSRYTQGTISETTVPTDLAISGEGFFVVRDGPNNINYATRAGNFRSDDQEYLVTSQGFRLQGMNNGDISYDVTVNASTGKLEYTPTFTAPSSVGDIRIDFNLGVGSGLTNNTGGAFTDEQITQAAPRLEAFQIEVDGRITLTLSDGKKFTRGQVLLTDFSDPQALVHAGNGLYSNWDAAGARNGGVLDPAFNAPNSSSLGKIEAGKLELSNVELTEEFANIITMQRSFQAGARVLTTSDQILEEIVNLKR